MSNQELGSHPKHDSSNPHATAATPVEALVNKRLADMCSYMGIMPTEKHLFWIAQMALVAKLPPYWKEYKDAEGHVSVRPYKN
jgi:hypothetical protein